MGLPGAGLPPRALEEKNGMKYTGSTPEKQSKGVCGSEAPGTLPRGSGDAASPKAVKKE